MASVTFNAEEKAKLTKHLGINAGSTDAQILAALLAQQGHVARVQDAPTPQCPACGQYLQNAKNPAST